MIDQEFFNLAEAAEELGMPEHAVLRMIRNGALPICFDADETLTGVTIQTPDNTIEHVALPVPLAGVLACHGDAADADGINAVGVRVMNIRGITFSRNPDGTLTKGHKLPNESNGYIKPGYRVTGFVDFVRVEMADWLFHRDDLQPVKVGAVSVTMENSAPPAPAATTADTTGMVAWQAAVLESWSAVSKKYGNKTTARNVMAWCKSNTSPRDVFGCKQPQERDSMTWLDVSGGVHTLTLARLGTVLSEWRSAMKIPAK